MTILILVLKGFEMMELSPFIDIVGWANTEKKYDINFKTCSITPHVVGSFGIEIISNLLISEIDITQYDALAIPGGFEEYGFYDEAFNEEVLNLINKFHQYKKPIASVCVGALPLAKSGILNEKKATTYHLKGGYRQKQLSNMGALVLNESIVIDGNIITSSCPQTAPYVAFELLKMLLSEDKVNVIKLLMGF